MTKTLKQSDSIKPRIKYSQPDCPHCYSGNIVEDFNVNRVFFCDNCFEEVKIKKFKK